MLASREPKAAVAADSWKGAVGLLLLASFLLVFFYAALSEQHHWRCPECPVAGEVSSAAAPSPHPDRTPTNVSHILFGIGGSALTWRNRRHYSELWWRPEAMRGFVWLDKKPPHNEAWPERSPPYKVSEDAKKFKGRTPSRSEVRMARIVAESVRLGVENVRWYVMGDDDTVFFTENLVAVLGKYDHREMYYVGAPSESVEQNVMHSYGMAFGGGGFAVSAGLAAELNRLLDGCMDRYANLYGSDQRVHACLNEIGVPLTTERGFHQVDLRGNVYGLLAAHPIAPLVTLHHLDTVEPLVPGRTQHEAVQSLLGASRLDPARVAQHSFGYDKKQKWSVSTAWGYTVQLYPWIVRPNDLSVPLRTFRTWRSYKGGPFTFNTRPLSPNVCEQPLTYFLDYMEDLGRDGTRSVYSRQRKEAGKECQQPEFVKALSVETVTVYAPKMIPQEWWKAPRRQCCDVRHGTKNSIQVNIRRCRRHESTSPP